MTKKLIFLLLISILFFSCYNKTNIRKITTEPSIERAFEAIEKSKNYKHLVKYINKNKIKIEYINDSSNCIRYDFNNQKILLPRLFKESDFFLTLSILKAIYIWKIHNEFKLDELLMEEEILGTIKQVHYIFENNYSNKTLEKDKLFNTYLKDELCTYVTINTPMTSHVIINKNSIVDNKCGRPLENIISQKEWFASIKQAMQNNTFFELMYNKNMQKVRKGSMTQAEAIKNDAILRSKPLYEIYRDQRNFYDVSMEKIEKFEKYYKKELEEDREWRIFHKDDIENARYEFSFCMENL